MNAGRTARERARADLTRQIKDEARTQLARTGADGLSLRAVARELGMVSSALYRYFPSRDELLTALIIDAYDTLGAAVEQACAEVDRSDPRGRWRRACTAVRSWSKTNPHEYALIYGSPVPGYQAPQATVTSAARVPLAMVAILSEGAEDGLLLDPPQDGPLTPVLAEQITALRTLLASQLPDLLVPRLLIAWTQLFGMIGFELFGQLVGSVDPSDEFFAHAVELMATFVGLPEQIV
jgi:AcrR family transcriptional regulator